MFWFFGYFRCGMLLFVVLPVLNKLVKQMLNVRVPGDHLHGKLNFTWLSLVMSLRMSFCAVLFPTGCLRWDLKVFYLILYKYT